MIFFDEDSILCQCLCNSFLNYFWKTTSGGLFMSNLYVIDIVGKRQAAALHEQLVRILLFFGKRQATALHEQLVRYLFESAEQ